VIRKSDNIKHNCHPVFTCAASEENNEGIVEIGEIIQVIHDISGSKKFNKKKIIY